MNKWAKIGAYYEVPSLIDTQYARALFAGCQVSASDAYEWLFFLDMAGVEDDGDFYYHDVYPEPAPNASFGPTRTRRR